MIRQRSAKRAKTVEQDARALLSATQRVVDVIRPKPLPRVAEVDA